MSKNVSAYVGRPETKFILTTNPLRPIAISVANKHSAPDVIIFQNRNKSPSNFRLNLFAQNAATFKTK